MRRELDGRVTPKGREDTPSLNEGEDGTQITRVVRERGVLGALSTKCDHRLST